MNKDETDAVAIVQTLRLVKVYGERRVIDNVELRVPSGSVFGLLGRNGAGKSTTIRMLLGLVEPTGGEVRLFDRWLATDRLELLGRVGALVEGPAFYPYLSGARNLKCLADLTRHVSWERVEVCLDRVGLLERGRDKYGSYSTGMRQRLGIAATLIHDPELIILDEPFNGLDPPAVLLLRRLIGELRDEGKTVLVSSHLLHEVELVCDQVALLEQGRLVSQGSVESMLRTDTLQLDLHTSQPEAALSQVQALSYVAAAEEQEGGLRLQLSEDRAAELNKKLVQAGIDVSALIPKQRSLEELFHDSSVGVGP